MNFEEKATENSVEQQVQQASRTRTSSEYATEKATLNATKTGSVLGLDSWTDFDMFENKESGEFSCFRGSAMKLLDEKATMFGQGNNTIIISFKHLINKL